MNTDTYYCEDCVREVPANHVCAPSRSDRWGSNRGWHGPKAENRLPDGWSLLPENEITKLLEGDDDEV